MVVELSYKQVRGVFPESSIECKSTAELTPLKEIIGQERAVRALQFGLKIEDKGFNIYISGMPGTGRKTAIINFLEEFAKTKPVPPDWCYVDNFQDSNRPRALRLPAGKGAEFMKDMELFVSEIKRVIGVVFESEEYARRRGETLKAIEEERNEVTRQVNKIAGDAGFLL